MVNLFVNYYLDKNPERQKEIELCLQSNFNNNAINNLMLLYSVGVKLPEYLFMSNIMAWHFEENARPMFRDYFTAAMMVSKDDDISIISNSDIYFDENSIQLIKDNLKENECYCLSRWDIQQDGTSIHFNRWDSFDTWIFKGKIKPIEYCYFSMGVAGCDDSITERIQRAGYIVKNPSIDIKSFHLHLSGVRNYNPQETTPKPYLLIQPHTLNETNIIYHRID